mmetsp:Transcript_48421/g.115127  ORF Transcript_48421/g.115127 Transcript_48421/m.115127 type:complete len:467 (-) Transcript_48421:196-1596(-)|eukprot:CAMPEP_0178404172 /NCGR_PEP_ID=MMETSP0689_2-20121128/17743_1 /TAXON_ID=160604 /ORGANISM="Amphidinium massartii, Strain CS-259" /LENGTH=466 /DNA_ID=CAMNT_0020025141 /DNA_START=126 /DNA_END=1526 /DNA_ORIENTATION=-
MTLRTWLGVLSATVIVGYVAYTNNTENSTKVVPTSSTSNLRHSDGTSPTRRDPVLQHEGAGSPAAEPALESGRRLHYGTTEAPFAQTALHFKFQLKEILKEQGGFATKSAPGIYTEEDAHDIMRALRQSHDLQEGFWQTSGKTSLNHGVGAASCMLLARAPATYVSTAILHGAYQTIWTGHELGKSSHPQWTDDICPRRRYLQKAVSNVTEAALWRYYTMYSANEDLHNPTLLHKLMDQKTQQLPLMDKYLQVFAICDDIEQFQHDEQLFTNNERNHDQEYTASLLQLLGRLEQDAELKHLDFSVLRPFMEKAYEQTHDRFLHNPDQYEQEFKLRDTIELSFRAAADPPVKAYAHQPHIRRSVLWCRAPENQDVCANHWHGVTAFWESACCERGGPCVAHDGEKWQKNLPKKRLGLPVTMPTTLTPRLLPQRAGVSAADLDRSPQVFIDKQRRMKDINVKLQVYEV